MRRDPGPGVDGDPSDLAVDELALARVQPGAYVDAELAHTVDDRLGATDGACRAVERGEEPVAGGVHLAAASACELPTDNRVVALEQLAPTGIAELGHLLRRADDVGEEDGRKHAVGLNRRVRLPGVAKEGLDWS